MKLQQSYTSPPIIEALIDLRVERLSDLTVTALKEIQSSISSDYPVTEDLAQVQGEFQMGSAVTATATQTPVGCRFLSEDRTRIFQARLDGFTFSQLEPYTRWEAVRDEARRLWSIYSTATRLKKIQRVAVRYINRLNLPYDSSGRLDLKDYLKTFPEVSPDLPQDLSDYVMQLQIPQLDLEAQLVLAESIIGQSTSPSIVSILLDIDLFSFVDLPVDSDAAWNLLDRFRLRKNEVFEACITDKTRELFK